jgi:aminoglycoside/choline kinase family phosphotransferase
MTQDSIVSRRPYAYRTSHRLELVEVELEDKSRVELLLKDLRRSEPDSAAQLAKPEFLYNPLREIEAYELLKDEGLEVPTLHAVGDGWLMIEKIDGVELWQVGELSIWMDAARWLAKLHLSFAGRRSMGRNLLQYDADFFRVWPRRAVGSDPGLTGMTARYDRVVEILTSLPTTLVHGDFYASNVMVAPGRIAPIDWEMAGVGPGVLDLAALTSGWSDDEMSSIVAAYGDVTAEQMDAARLHVAMQWLGWSKDWTPPPEHARNWRDEAVMASERLGL